MTLTDFNTKWKSCLADDFYGLDINDEKVIAYLDKEFENETKENSDFEFKQIKMKFGFCRIYAASKKVVEWESQINELLKIIYKGNTLYKMIKFTKPNYFPDILNSEGSLLAIVEAISNESENERLYLKAKIGFGTSVYCKVNETVLNFFFLGRISVKELFLLRNDEPFIVEKTGKNGNLSQKLYWFTQEFENEILNHLPFFNLSFFSISDSVRIPSPNENIIKKLDLYYINSFAAISEYKLYQKNDEIL